jgi:hypothetical protein
VISRFYLLLRKEDTKSLELGPEKPSQRSLIGIRNQIPQKAPSTGQKHRAGGLLLGRHFHWIAQGALQCELGRVVVDDRAEICTLRRIERDVGL